MSGHRDVVRVGVAAALVDGVITPGDVELTAGRVSGHGLQPGRAGLAVPGFVDLQVNGFGGVDFLHADDAGYRRAGRALLSTGVTAYQPTFPSAPFAETVSALARLARLGADPIGPRVLPAHLEGPFLSERRRGAHDRLHLARVSLAVADALCDAGPVGMMTVAPESDGGLQLIGHLTRRGVVVALGHSDATAAVAASAFDAGATAVTHLFNAMRPISARDPGLAGVALTRPGVIVMAIIDGIHLAPPTVALLLAMTRGRLCLVTDAIEAAGVGDGESRLGGQTVVVAGSEARLADGTLAGSVLSMDAAVRNLVTAGAGVEAAVDAATRVPGRLVGDADLGRLQLGCRGDVAVLDDALEVRRTLVGGVDVDGV